MDNDTINQQANVGANPDNEGANATPANNGGNSQPQSREVNKHEGENISQEQLDKALALARGTAERETTKKLMAKLGLKADEEDKLLAFKEAYEASLSDEEKRSTELANLQAEKLKLSQDLEEKDYTIKALIELTGKKEDDVADIVKMSKGLKTDDNTIEDCIKKVISMIQPKVESVVKEPTTVENNMPTGQPIQQPSKVIIDTQENPFKEGPTYNLTKQGELMRSNPELAKKLASEVGIQLRNI